ALFPADDAQAVLERGRGIAIGDPARELVCEQEAEPDQELAREVTPAAGEIATADRLNGSGHAGVLACSGAILTSAAAPPGPTMLEPPTSDRRLWALACARSLRALRPARPAPARARADSRVVSCSRLGLQPM